MLNIITQEAARQNVRQMGAKLFDSDALETHPKQAQIMACYKRMKEAAQAPKFNAILYLEAETNLSKFLTYTK